MYVRPEYIESKHFSVEHSVHAWWQMGDQTEGFQNTGKSTCAKLSPKKLGFFNP